MWDNDGNFPFNGGFGDDNDDPAEGYGAGDDEQAYGDNEDDGENAEEGGTGIYDAGNDQAEEEPAGEEEVEAEEPPGKWESAGAFSRADEPGNSGMETRDDEPWRGNPGDDGGNLGTAGAGAGAADDDGLLENAAAGAADDDGPPGSAGGAAYDAYEPPPLDPDVFGSREDYPEADAGDFADDTGDWTDEDYQESTEAFFGSHEYFGDTAERRYLDEGYEPWEGNREYLAAIAGFDEPASRTVDFFHRGGEVIPLGFVTITALELLQSRFPALDFSRLHITVPGREMPGEYQVEPQPLPGAIQSLDPRDSVDLRKFSPPVGDQGQTSRCAAFAWTHALETAKNILNEPAPPLSCNFTMLQFQKHQGDSRDFTWAYRGGDGTNPGPEPGALLFEKGTCRKELWPDDEKKPRVSEEEMARDAASYRLRARLQPIGLEDVKKVLTAGCPVQLSMNTGENFSTVGRDGVFNAAERPSGTHGRHAMLLAGYTGNYFIVKNSWGEEWGNGGYCYIPRKVLAESEPDCVAILLEKPGTSPVGSSPAGQAGQRAGSVVPATAAAAGAGTGSARPSASSLPSITATPQAMPSPPPVMQQAAPPRPAPPSIIGAFVKCPACQKLAPPGKFCNACGSPLHVKKFCVHCGTSLPPGAKFCGGCGKPTQ